MQEVLNDPVLCIPEVVDVRWLSHHKVVHAVVRSYFSIMTACEHIHIDGADLASMAGGILLDLHKTSFVILLCGLDEVLGAVANLSLKLQKFTLHASSLTNLIESTVAHLTVIHDRCQDDNFEIMKSVTAIQQNASSL